MTLLQWLDETGTSDTALARLVGTTPSTINRAKRGLLNLSAETALAVERATGGAVAADTLSPAVATVRGVRFSCGEGASE